jgi:hypothetical protein
VKDPGRTFGIPLDKATKHRPIAVHNRWSRAFDLGSKARLRLFLSPGTCTSTAHIFSMERFVSTVMVCEWIEVDGKEGNTLDEVES